MELTDLESRLRDEFTHAVDDLAIPGGLLAAGEQLARRRAVRRRAAAGVAFAALVAPVGIGLARSGDGARQDVVASPADGTSATAQPDDTSAQTCTATYQLTGSNVQVAIRDLDGARSATVTAALPDGGAAIVHADLTPNLDRVTLDVTVSAPPTQVSVELSPDQACVAVPARQPGDG